MAYGDQHDRRDRMAAAALTAFISLSVGAALLAGGSLPGPIVKQSRTSVSAITLPAPPPSAPEPEAKKAPEPEGAAAPPAKKAKAAAIVAPKPKIPRPSPMQAAPAAGIGNEAKSGAAPTDGPGTGGGGSGAGTGSGNAGSGGGGGGGSKARLVKGRIKDSDYPKSASRDKAGGKVTAHFTVEANGRVTGCTIAGSSGNADIDATTCRLIEERFRYEPARDASGNPIASKSGWQQTWWLESRR